MEVTYSILTEQINTYFFIQMLYRKKTYLICLVQFAKANPLVQFVDICLELNVPYEFHSFNVVKKDGDCKF